jgi:hypothetical protein
MYNYCLPHEAIQEDDLTNSDSPSLFSLLNVWGLEPLS